MTTSGPARSQRLRSAAAEGKLRRVLLICLLCLACAICVYLLLAWRAGLAGQRQLESQLREAATQHALETRYGRDFQRIRDSKNTAGSARVRWTERLQNELGALQTAQLSFSIEDPDWPASDLPALAATTMFRQYPLRIDATVADDAQLLALLRQLAGYASDMIDNRGCRLDKPAATAALQLSCLYAIHDIDLRSEPLQ